MNWYRPKTWFARGIPFYEISTTTFFGEKQAVFIDTSQYDFVYRIIPQLKTVIDRDASMFSNLRWMVVDANDVSVDDPVLDLLNNPNPLQSGEEWLKDLRKKFLLYGDDFILGNRALSTSQPVTLFNLPTGNITINTTGKMFKQVEIDGIIENYELRTTDKTELFEPNQILHLKNVDPKNPIKGKSNVDALKHVLSIIDGAYRSMNILINDRGAFGIISGQAKDGQGGVPLGDKERTKIEKEYRKKYGNRPGQNRWIISETPLKFDKLSVPMKELMLREAIDDGFLAIVDAYGHNLNIYSRPKGSTFENVKQGEVITYQDTIIPFANSLAEDLTVFTRLNLRNRRLVASYAHVPVLQEDMKLKSEVLLNVSRAINQLSAAGVQLPAEQQTLIFEEIARIDI